MDRTPYDASPYERVQALKTITPDELERLRRLCQRSIFHPTLAEDSFLHAIAVAYEFYDGRVPIEHYLLKVARNYAITQCTKYESNADQFSDADGDEVELSRVESVPDPRDYFAEPEISWLRTALLVLQDEAADTQLSRGARIKARRAKLILLELVQSERTGRELRADNYHDVARVIGISDGSAVCQSTVEGVMTYLRHKVYGFLPQERKSIVVYEP
jgi:DNA-directed RNA polymerase specialized sigma24 family protein